MGMMRLLEVTGSAFSGGGEGHEQGEAQRCERRGRGQEFCVCHHTSLLGAIESVLSNGSRLAVAAILWTLHRTVVNGFVEAEWENGK